MSYPKPWILGNVVINDGIDWHAAEWASTLRGWQGLPRAQAITTERYGAWPLVAGVRRPTVKRFLETHFLQLLETDRKLARRLYLQALDYEEEIPYRLLCADVIPPGCATDKALLALGPLNVQTDGLGNWTIKDLINPDNVEAAVTGAVHFVPGREGTSRAIVVEDGRKNHILNPSFELNITDGWTNVGYPTYERSTDQHLYGQASLHCISDAAADLVHSSVVADADAGETWTAFLWVYLVAGDFALYIEENAGGWAIVGTVAADTGLLNEWQKVSVTVTLSGGVTDAMLVLAPVVTDISEFYVDGVNFIEDDCDTSHIDGSLGPGYVWDAATPHNDTSTRTSTLVELDDHVSLVSGKDELTLRIVAQMPHDYDAVWTSAAYNYLSEMKGVDSDHRIAVWFNASVFNRFEVFINGDTRLEAPAQIFSEGDWLELIVTLDFAANEYKLYIDSILVDTDMTALTAPILTDWAMGSLTTGSQPGGFAIEQYQVFNKVYTPAEIAVLDGRHLKARWIDVLCDQTDPLTMGGKETTLGFVATLNLHDDVRFRSRDGDAWFTMLCDDSVAMYVDVDTEDIVRPIMYVEPQTAKTSGFKHRAWFPVIWPADVPYMNYPIGVIGWDTATIIAAGDMLANGDDLRVYSDGVELDRWLSDIDTGATNVWFNLDFVPAGTTTLATAILIGDIVTEIDAGTSIAAFPSVGILMIDSEIFLYEGIDYTNKRFLEVSRAARGTAAAGHALNATISWVQHDVWVYYDDAALGAPTVDDDYKPVFELDLSDNTDWVFEEFGEDYKSDRPATWLNEQVLGTVIFYTGNHATNVTPWEEIGISATSADTHEGRWYLYHPCGISIINVTDGETYCSSCCVDTAKLQSSPNGTDWIAEYSIPTGAAVTWNAWNRNETLEAESLYVALWVRGLAGGCDRKCEISVCTLTIATPPTATLGTAQTNYAMDLTITNETTGQALRLQTNLALGHVVEIDTDARTVRNLSDPESLYVDMIQIGGIRKEWLMLLEGENEITLEDADATQMDFILLFDRRYYE